MTAMGAKPARRRWWLVAAAAWTAAGAVLAQPLRFERSVPLPSIRGRLDHLAFDAAGQRVFVAALGADSLEVVDWRAGRVRTIGGLHEPQGVAYLEGARRLLVANGEGGTVQAFDGADAPATASAGGLPDADNLRLDPAASLAWVGTGSAIVALDPRTLQVTRSIRVEAHPEAFELEVHGPRLFANVPGGRQVAVVDRSRGEVVATWPLPGVSRNFAMALDEAHQRLFVAARQPASLLVLDTGSGARIAQLALCGDADDLFFDAARRQLYAVCGEGVVDVLREEGADHWTRVQRVNTAPGARTGLFVPALSTLFVAVPARGGASAELRSYRIGNAGR